MKTIKLEYLKYLNELFLDISRYDILIFFIKILYKKYNTLFLKINSLKSLQVIYKKLIVSEALLLTLFGKVILGAT